MKMIIKNYGHVRSTRNPHHLFIGIGRRTGDVRLKRKRCPLLALQRTHEAFVFAGYFNLVNLELKIKSGDLAKATEILKDQGLIKEEGQIEESFETAENEADVERDNPAELAAGRIRSRRRFILFSIIVLGALFYW